MAQIEDYLIEMNPWWKGELKLEYKDREIYNQIKNKKINIMPAYKYLFKAKGI